MQDRNGCPLDELLAEADLMQEANAIEIEHTQVCYRLINEMLG